MKHAALAILSLALAGSIKAQPSATSSSHPLGVTTLTLAADVANGIAPPAPGSRVRVPSGEQVNLLVPTDWPHPIQWTKDGKPIAGATGRSHLILLTATSDSGLYNITGAPFPHIATGISLEVVPSGHLGNFSARLELAPGGAPQIIGFVVNGTTPKNLLIRAVGPSLRKFGITKPAAQPRLRFFDSAGREIAFVHPAVVIDTDAFFASAGAFPLIAGEKDAFDYGSFPSGACTIHVSDSSGAGGTVLVESYEYTVGPPPLQTAR